MISEARIMLGCHWSRHRLERYLDRDPAALLASDEVIRLEHRLAVCARCRPVADEHRTLRRLLANAAGHAVDADALERLHALVAQLASGAR